MEDMILDRPSSSNETSDRISQLPEHIILQILFFLPVEDAARSSILSKTWLSLWKSLPIFSFSSDTLSRKEILLKQDASFDAEANGYMDLIEKSLKKLLHNKARIKRFQLDLFKSHEKHDSQFNQFMELANRNHVEELVLHGLVSGQNRERPSLPSATFVSTNPFSLLALEDMVLTPEILKDEPRFPCLQKLFLSRVKLSGMIENMLANCPLLKKFSLERCDVERVRLCDHPKLNDVTIEGVPSIWIESKIMERFQCDYTGGKPLELHLVSWENLQVLNLISRFTAEYIQDMVAKSPLLRVLILSPYNSLERLKVSSPSLQLLCIYTVRRGADGKEIEIDAPNLQRYQYYVANGKPAATPVFINSPRLQAAEVIKHLRSRDLPSQWFVHLLYCLPSFEYNAMRIFVWRDMTNKDIVVKNLRQISVDPPVHLDVLSVIAYRSPFDFAALFDCCFWICRPNTIIIKTSCETTVHLEDQLQRGKLIPWEENPTCCGNSQRKSWQHYLDDVKIGEAIKMKDDYYARTCHGVGIALTSSQVELIALHLKWKMTGQKEIIDGSLRKIYSNNMNLVL